MEKTIFKNEMILDAETSGLHHEDYVEYLPDGTARILKQNGIVQLTAHAFINGEEKFHYNEFFKPLPGQLVDPKALEVNGLTMDQLRGFQDPRIAFDLFMDKVKIFIDPYDKKQKFTIVGYNVRFDDEHLRKWFKNIDEKTWYGSYFRWPAVDVANLAAVYLKDRYVDMPDFKLMTVAATLGIEIDPEKAHDSNYDVEITRQLFRLLCEKMGL